MDYQANNITYRIIEGPGSWYAIYEYEDGEWIPLVQAGGLKKAKEWCDMREKANIPLRRL